MRAGGGGGRIGIIQEMGENLNIRERERIRTIGGGERIRTVEGRRESEQ